jgi:hypothetical protein
MGRHSLTVRRGPAGGGRLVVHVPDGRGHELHVHLKSHGIDSLVSEPAESPSERVEVQGDVDPVELQALVDLWER